MRAQVVRPEEVSHLVEGAGQLLQNVLEAVAVQSQDPNVVITRLCAEPRYVQPHRPALHTPISPFLGNFEPWIISIRASL